MNTLYYLNKPNEDNAWNHKHDFNFKLLEKANRL